MNLESMVPYRIMRKGRVEKALGILPDSSKRLIGNVYLIKRDDAQRVHDIENPISAFIRYALKAAEEARIKASYMR